MTNNIQYVHSPDNHSLSEPTKYNYEDLGPDKTLLNIGPQHPSTHGLLRLETLLQGEEVIDVVPHIGYLHRCFEKHAEKLPYSQIIPFVDRLDYLSAMNSEHAFAMGVERMLGIEKSIPLRVEYIRVLVTELNRMASHFLSIGTYGIDLGAYTPFLWLMRDREHILRLLEWVCGARLLYNYIWIGGLFYDLPNDFEDRCKEFIDYVKPKLKILDKVLIDNSIFKDRTANVGVLPLDIAIAYGVSGPMLRASGLRLDLRKVDAYSIYKNLDFNIPIGEGIVGTLGDCWDRTWVRRQECDESIKIIEQCIEHLLIDCKRDSNFDLKKILPKKIIVKQPQDLYIRAENPRGEIGFFFRAQKRSTIPVRCKVRAPSFANLAVLPEICKGHTIVDLIAIIGSIDIVLGEVDR